MINNRQQNGRRRGRSNQRPPQGGNGGGGRQDNGNRIDNRSRGNAAQMLEKYKTLARDAQQSGDRVLTEYYLQFSDHYFRVLADGRARQEENQPRRDARYDGDDQGFEGEEGFEGDEGDEFDPRPQQRAQPQPQPQQRYDRDQQQERGDEGDPRPRRDYGERNSAPARANGSANGSDRQPRDDYRRDEPPRQQRQPREERPRDERPRDDRPRDERPREDRPRDERPRDDRPRPNRERRPVREEVAEEATLSLDILPPSIAAAPDVSGEVAGEEAPAPKRRGRPKKVVSEAPLEG